MDRRLPSKLVTSLMMALMVINPAVSSPSARPKLVVGIVIDQLRTDYLQYLESLFGESGFRRLMNEGLFLKQVDFNADVNDPVASTAIIYTGNYPMVNGISSSVIYDSSERREMESLSDKGSLGHFTSEALSPANLRISTISDELAIDGAGLTAIYAISPDPQQSIIMAGHAGNSALWINDNDGKWSSTAYYKDFPSFITRRNSTNPLSLRLDTLQWRPVMSVDAYPGVPAQKRYYPFRHTFSRSDKGVFKKFKQSATVNKEVTDVAVEAIRNLGLGSRGDAIDMLNIGYTAAPYKYVNDGDYRIELEDTYLRLDSQIERLLKEIDSGPGLENTLIFLSSTGYYDDATPDDPKYGIPSGDVSLRRMESLLNSFLTAKYGNADYVSGIWRNQVYLDRRQFDSKGIAYEKALAESCDFLVKMSGVSEVRTLGNILTDPGEEAGRMRRSIDPKKCGDLFITFAPGWNVVDDCHYPPTTTPVRAVMVSTPFIMMGPGVKGECISAPVDAAVIAPTVTSALHIRSPNGAFKRPLPLK